MRFKIRDIGEGGLAIREPITAAWLATECRDLEAKPSPTGVMLTGRIEKSGRDSFLLRASLRGELVAACGRCLEPARIAIDVPLVASFAEKEPADTEDADDEGDAIFGFSDNMIDLGPAIRDEILLSMPIGPVCKEDCAGICSHCGGNRNTAPCDCEERQRRAHSKLGAVSKLKLKDQV